MSDLKDRLNGNYYATVPRSAAGDRSLHETDFRVYVALMSFLNPIKGYAYPTREQLQEATGIKHWRNINRSLKKLNGLGYVTWQYDEEFHGKRQFQHGGPTVPRSGESNKGVPCEQHGGPTRHTSKTKEEQEDPTKVEELKIENDLGSSEPQSASTLVEDTPSPEEEIILTSEQQDPSSVGSLAPDVLSEEESPPRLDITPKHKESALTSSFFDTKEPEPKNNVQWVAKIKRSVLERCGRSTTNKEIQKLIKEFGTEIISEAVQTLTPDVKSVSGWLHKVALTLNDNKTLALKELEGSKRQAEKFEECLSTLKGLTTDAPPLVLNRPWDT